jgi:hypothetical protein
VSKKEIALALLARGWSVIPLWPKSKQAMRSWTEFQQRRATPEEVEKWWTDEPEANVGVITGAISGIIVGDVDPRNGGSVEQMQKDAPSEHVVLTPGGGAHFYYRHPGGRVRKGKPRPGIDLQSDGCYVVAAGSYVKTERYEGEYTTLIETALATPPAWLLGEQPQEQLVHTPSTDSWIASALAEGCAPGTRNDTLAKLAGYFAGKGVPEDVATSMLVPWVLRQEGTGVTPHEAQTTIGSIYAKERTKKKAAAGYDPSEKLVVDEFSVEVQKDRPLETEPLASFLPKHWRDKVEWLIPEWLPARTIAFLVSPPGKFKTMLTFDAAISVAGGWPFLGRYAVQHPGPVLVIQQEDDYGDMARRFNRIFAERAPQKPQLHEAGDMIRTDLGSDVPEVYICTTRGFNLDMDNLRKLERKFRVLQPRLCIIDPLYSITSAEDFMMNAARDMMPLKRLRDVYGTAFLIAAHTKKGGDSGREGLWGSQFLNAFLETGWQVREREDGEWNQVQLQRHFKTTGIPSRMNLEFLLDDDDGYRVEVTEEDDENAVHDAVVAELAKHPDGLTAPTLAERTGLSSRTVQRRLLKLQKKGAVVTEKGRGKHGSVTWKVPKDTTAALDPEAA